jgi:hypothetical protein
MMRYYIYVSETKVEQLYAQIPTKLRAKIAAKFTIDLKLIKGEFEGRQPQESLFSKLDIVRTYLEDEGLIGTADDPKSFFGEIMPLSWGPYGGSDEEEDEFVYFGGRTEETIVGLGGSLKHVIGEVGRLEAHSYSLTQYLVDGLRDVMRASGVDRELGENEATALACVGITSGRMGGPWERMEFVAKRLTHGIVNNVWWNPRHHDPFGGQNFEGYEDVGQIRAVLGTPLFVAMAE